MFNHVSSRGWTEMGYFYKTFALLLLVSDIPVVCAVLQPNCPDVACLSSFAGILAVAGVSSVAGIMAVAGFIAVANIFAFAGNPALAGISTVLGIPNVVGISAAVSFMLL
jgi:hypothetical protein